ncbi:alpha-1,2-fucosyltransferase [Helicobacter sp. MIT 21-1697]|uniref:alpha-1,2-fucosyltransferase n=1 Tax=Helicobacter sp. MIT 21-1697 TaxID=2993733 RepID=UPI00224B0A48|nr:alpha-1,2-fucosyltransferase [Helicobacter sp. MIT 21-1697]MCX2716492.1 alpha-1,2-fucosyltransferase [Helicobacter sp. MIT 21-1697]
MQYKIVELTCGLGNQMFQYAFAKSLEHHLQMPILLDKTWFEVEGKKHSIPFSLGLFNIDLPYATQEQISALKEKFNSFESKPKIMRSILKRVGYPRVARSFAFEYKAQYLKPNPFAYFVGFFQNPLYFKEIASHIKEVLCPPPH